MSLFTTRKEVVKLTKEVAKLAREVEYLRKRPRDTEIALRRLLQYLKLEAVEEVNTGMLKIQPKEK